MKRRLNILVLTSTFPRWRGDTSPMFVADLCAGLAQRMGVTVLAPGAKGARAVEERDGYTVRRFRYGWPAGTQRLAVGAIMPNIRRNPLLLAQVPPFFIAQLVTASSLMRREHFDAIHAHWAIPQGVVASILKKIFRVPVITTTHGGDIYALRGGPALHAKRWALRSSDRVTAVSNALRTDVIGLGTDARRVSVLPMGVDTTRFTPEAASPRLRDELNPSGGPIILFVGRLVEKKGARYAIEAMPAVLAQHPDARLVLVGDGPERSTLEALVTDLGISASTEFLGPVSNLELPAFYASVDAFVGPSVIEANGDTESFGVVFAEAMASGCPVIATDVGGIGDLVQHRATGLVVQSRDSSALADAVSEILAGSELKADVTTRALRLMRERFDHAKLHLAYAHLIEEVAA